MESKNLDRLHEKEIKKDFGIKLFPMNDETGNTVWAAEITELPGCVGAGDTPQEALNALDDAKKAWIEIALTDNKQIPEPSGDYDIDYSGKFTLRLPKLLHKSVSEKAREEGVSLNQYLLFLITKHHYETLNKIKDSGLTHIKKQGLINEEAVNRQYNNRNYKILVDNITNKLAKGKKVHLVGFGTFEIRSRKERERCNSATGEKMKIKALKVPVFKPDKALKEKVK